MYPPEINETSESFGDLKMNQQPTKKKNIYTVLAFAAVHFRSLHSPAEKQKNKKKKTPGESSASETCRMLKIFLKMLL